MIPYEVMLSESQERMLVIVKRGREKEAKGIFEKWDLNAVKIGEVTSDGIFRVLDKGKVVAEIPAKSLAQDAPVYFRKTKKCDYLKEVQSLDTSHFPQLRNYNQVLQKLLDSPNIARKAWVYEQYDHMVRTNTIVLPGSDSAILRIKGTKKALAISCDGNGRYCYLDPYEGGKIAVAEAARNLVCSGAKPLAITNCLNFGTPTDPEVFYQFTRCVEGMAKACRVLNTPVSGGNVSFYNENPEGAIDPTPVVGMVGLIDDINFISTPWFKREGDLILLLGESKEELGGSEYLYFIHNLKKGTPPSVDLNKEKSIQGTCLEVIKKGLVSSAHDCSEGGMAVALAKCCIGSIERKLGAVIELSSSVRDDALLFGETQSRILLSCSPNNLFKIEEIAQKNKVKCQRIGKVAGDKLIIKRNGKILIDAGVDKLFKIWEKGLSRRL